MEIQMDKQKFNVGDVVRITERKNGEIKSTTAKVTHILPDYSSDNTHMYENRYKLQIINYDRFSVIRTLNEEGHIWWIDERDIELEP